MANIFELPSKDGNITPEKVRKSRQNSVYLGSSLSMRSFAIDEPGSSVRALYATLPSSMNDGNFQFLISSRFQIIEDLRLKGPAYHKKNVPQDVLSPSIEDNRIFCQ